MNELAAKFAAARLGGCTLADVPKLTLGEGYALADEAAPLLGVCAGWKVGATNSAGQQFLGIDEPICGRIFRDSVVTSGTTLTISGDRVAEAEPEILFRLGNDFEQGTDPAGWIASVHLGIEINRASHDAPFDQGVGFIVADNAAQIGLVVGPGIDLALLGTPEAIGVTLTRNGDAVQAGNAVAVLGNPLNALRWLASCRSLNAGDWIATGAITRSCPLAPGDNVCADFGPLGSVEAKRL